MIAPTSDPTNAPTIPPQKRSGRKIVKCQIDNPIITQPSMPISGSVRVCRIETLVVPPVLAVSWATRLGLTSGLILHDQILRREIGRRIALRRLLDLALLRGAVGLLGLDLRAPTSGCGAHARPGASRLLLSELRADLAHQLVE